MGMLFYVLVVFLGLVGVVVYFIMLFVILKYVGVVYLFYLGIKMWCEFLVIDNLNLDKLLFGKIYC